MAVVGEAIFVVVVDKSKTALKFRKKTSPCRCFRVRTKYRPNNHFTSATKHPVYFRGVPGGNAPDKFRKELLNIPPLAKEVSLKASDVSGETSPLALVAADRLKSRDGLRCLNVPSR